MYGLFEMKSRFQARCLVWSDASFTNESLFLNRWKFYQQTIHYDQQSAAELEI